MSGFRVNGCGATDHYKKIKSLGTHLCPVCKNNSEFFLEEAKFKIDIFFIPTVTLKSRYAVMCGKCENGEFCSDQWANSLINNTGDVAMIFESRAQPVAEIPVEVPVENPAVRQTAASAIETTEHSASQRSVQQPISKVNATISFFKCSYCGVTQMHEGEFCSYCGKPVTADSDTAVRK